jgi:hypothetical protein
MKISNGALALSVAALALPSVVAAQNTPAAVSAVYECRAITDGTARLACFDAATAELKKAEDARTLVFADEEEFPAFKGEELRSNIQAARTNKAGRWIITLPDGTRWLQTDGVQPTFPPKAGDVIVLKRGMMGNYRANTRGTLFQVRQIG